MLARNKELGQEKVEVKQIEKEKTMVFISDEEEKKRREQGFAVKLSKEVFKGFLKEMKKVKNEQKKKENTWKVEKKQVIESEENKNGIRFMQSLGQAIENLENSENDRIDLKSKINKMHGKKNQGLQETEKTEQGVNWEVNHESLEQKRLSLREEELRLNLEKIRLIEEAKRIEREKQELEAKQNQKIRKKLSKKESSMENVILAVEDKAGKEDYNEDSRVLGGNIEEFSFSEPVNEKFLDEKKIRASRLEARFLSYLTVPDPCQKLD